MKKSEKAAPQVTASVTTSKPKSPAPKVVAIPAEAIKAQPAKKAPAAKAPEPVAAPAAKTAPGAKTIAKAADAAPKAAAAEAATKKQAAKPASAVPDKATIAKPAAEKATQPQMTAAQAPAPVQAAPASTPATASSAPAAQAVASAPKPAPKSSQTQVGTVNLKKPQTANDSAPVSSSPSPAPAVAAPAPRAETVVKPAPAAAKPAAKPAPQRTGFKAGEHIVYPAHGVGQIIAVEEQEVAGFKLELFVISFAKDKMTLKVPMPKVIAGAIRKLADADTVKKSLDTLTGRARIKRTMWSRRAQEYEAKINSGDLGSIAEVVRDLYRSEAQPEQSYSERQLYESALDRMAREIAAVQKLTDSEALKLIESHLQKGPKRGTKAEQAAEDLADEAVDRDIEEAA